jgi:hypothetical protein
VATGGIYQPGGEQRERGLAGPGGADDRDGAGTGRGIGEQVHVVQGGGAAGTVGQFLRAGSARGSAGQTADEGRRVVVVLETDVLEAEHAGAVGQGRSAVAATFGDVQDLLNAPTPDDGAREVPEHPAEGADGQRHQGEQVGDLDQFTSGQVPGRDPPGTERGHQQDPQVGQGVDHRVEPATHVSETDAVAAQLFGGVAETGVLGVLTAQCLDHVRTVEGLTGDLGDLGPQALRLDGDRRGHPLEGDVQGDEQGDHAEHHQQQHHVDGGDHDRRVDQHEDRGQGERERPHREEGGLHIGVHRAQQGAGGLATVPQQRYPCVHLDQTFAVGAEQFELGGGGEHTSHRHGHGTQHRDPDDEQAAAHERTGHGATAVEGGHDDVLGDVPDHARGDHLQRGEGSGTEEGQDEPALLLLRADQQTLQPGDQDGGVRRGQVRGRRRELVGRCRGLRGGR